jgi:hypothetical protein
MTGVVDTYTKLIGEIGGLERELEDLIKERRDLEKRVNEKKAKKELDPKDDTKDTAPSAPPAEVAATEEVTPPAATLPVANEDPGVPEPPSQPVAPPELPPELPAKLILQDGQIVLSNANYPPPTGVTLVPTICISLFDGRDIVDGKIQSVTTNDIVYTPYDAANKRYMKTRQTLRIVEDNEKIDTIKVIKPCLKESIYSTVTNPFRKTPKSPNPTTMGGPTIVAPPSQKQVAITASAITASPRPALQEEPVIMQGDFTNVGRGGLGPTPKSSSTPKSNSESRPLAIGDGRRKRNATKKLRKA